MPGRAQVLASVLVGSLRQFQTPSGRSRAGTPRQRSRRWTPRWYRLAMMDSAVVSMPDGTSAALLPARARALPDLLERTVEIHERLYREWPQLSRAYRDQLGEITSPERWEKTFAASTDDQP